MLDEIIRTWDRWAASGSAARALEGWQRQRPELQGWTMGELRAPESSERTDSMQAALVGLAQDGDTPAASTLIVQLRPGLCRLSLWAAAHAYQFWPLHETSTEVLSVFSEVVMRHCLTRRPAKIASNLLFDTRQRIWRAASNEVKATQAAAHAATMAASTARRDGLDILEDVIGEIDLVNAMDSALGQLNVTDQSRRLTAELAFRAWVLEDENVEIARDLGLGYQTVHTRLYRLRAMLRHVRDATGPGPARQTNGSTPPVKLLGPSFASRHNAAAPIMTALSVQ